MFVKPEIYVEAIEVEDIITSSDGAIETPDEPLE